MATAVETGLAAATSPVLKSCQQFANHQGRDGKVQRGAERGRVNKVGGVLYPVDGSSKKGERQLLFVIQGSKISPVGIILCNLSCAVGTRIVPRDVPVRAGRIE